MNLKAEYFFTQTSLKVLVEFRSKMKGKQQPRDLSTQ